MFWISFDAIDGKSLAPLAWFSPGDSDAWIELLRGAGHGQQIEKALKRVKNTDTLHQGRHGPRLSAALQALLRRGKFDVFR